MPAHWCIYNPPVKPMTGQSKLLLHIFSKTGAHIQLVTKMSREEIHKELATNEYANPMIDILAVDEQDDHIEFRMDRMLMMGYMVGKLPNVAMVAQPQNILVRPR